MQVHTSCFFIVHTTQQAVTTRVQGIIKH
jgi:hypothetical protein